MPSLLPCASSLLDQLNARYGTVLFLVLIGLSIIGVPVFRVLTDFAGSIVPYLMFV